MYSSYQDSRAFTCIVAAPPKSNFISEITARDADQYLHLAIVSVCAGNTNDAKKAEL